MTRRYLYNYQTIVKFNRPVSVHSVLLRCLPVRNSYMTIEDEHLIMSGDFCLSRNTDSFGNGILYGTMHSQHTVLAYVSTGVVSMRPYNVAPDNIPMDIWNIPTRLTSLTERDFAVLSLPEQPSGICHEVHDMLQYVPHSTTVDTTAAEVMASRCGVCQDYAHLMIALCRKKGIPARYACGFVYGTGATHAWVEVFDGSCWKAYDPTNDIEPDYGYMKIAHGRDASDCPVSRGVYVGNAMQETSVQVILQEI
ncbi:MAG: transglutaminase family protein [Prevotella sp.]